MKLLFENWRKYLNESLAKQMTDKMHEKWLLGYRKDKGNEPRYKPVPNNPSEEQLKSFKGIKMVDGVAHQNINQPANNIVPALNHKLNGGPAVDYAKGANKDEIISNATYGLFGKSEDEQLREKYSDYGQAKDFQKTYDKLLYKKEPVGSSLAAIKHLKQYR